MLTRRHVKRKRKKKSEKQIGNQGGNKVHHIDKNDCQKRDKSSVKKNVKEQKEIILPKDSSTSILQMNLILFLQKTKFF